jgi:hypothetical protein
MREPRYFDGSFGVPGSDGPSGPLLFTGLNKGMSLTVLTDTGCEQNLGRPIGLNAG